MAINSFLFQIQNSINTQILSINQKMQIAGNSADLISNILLDPFKTKPTFPNNVPIPKIEEANFEIPESFVNNIQQLKLPNLDDIHTKISELVHIPFENAKNIVKDKLGDIQIPKFKFNPISNPPEMTFCRDSIDTAWIDTVTEALKNGIMISIYVLFVCILLLVVINCFQIYFIHRKKLGVVRNIESFFVVKNGKFVKQDALSLYDKTNNPNLYNFLDFVSLKFSKNTQTQGHIKWFLSYICYSPALKIILLGVIGLVCVYFQIFIVENTIKTILPTLLVTLTKVIGDLASVATSYIKNAIGENLQPINNAIKNAQSDINQGIVLIIDESTKALNSTVGVVIKDFQTAIINVFEPIPVLKEAMIYFGECVVGFSMSDIEKVSNDIKVKLFVEFSYITPEMTGIDNESITSAINQLMKSYYVKSGFKGFLYEIVMNIIKCVNERLMDHILINYFIVLFGMSIFVVGIVCFLLRFSGHFLIKC